MTFLDCCCWFIWSDEKSAYEHFLQPTELLKRSQMQSIPFVCVVILSVVLCFARIEPYTQLFVKCKKHEIGQPCATPTSCRLTFFIVGFVRLNFDVEKIFQFFFHSKIFLCLLKCFVFNKHYAGSQNNFLCTCFKNNFGISF